jgi:hypothetical protein
MDPVSAAASLTGLITVANQLLRYCYAYTCAAVKYQREVQAITTEITQLSGILHAIQSIIVDIPEGHNLDPEGSRTDDAHLRNTIQLFRMEETLVACEQTLIEITNQLGKLSPRSTNFWKTTKKKLLWPLKRPSLAILFDRLERHKTTFILVLSAYGTYGILLAQLANAK